MVTNNFSPYLTLTILIVVTGLHTLDLFDTEQIVFLWDRISLPQLELWRIVTSFTWCGPGILIDFPVLMLLYSMVSIVPSYEKDPHDVTRIQQQVQQYDDIPTNNEDIRDRIVNQWTTQSARRRRPRSDCIFAFICCAIIILSSYLLLTETSILMYITRYIPIRHPILIPVFTRTLLYSIITLHSLKHPDQQQNINFFPIPGKYVPLFHIVFGMFMKYRVNETVHGIVVGLIYAYLANNILFTPHWLVHLVGEDGNMITEEGVIDAITNNPYPNVRLEPGANFLHHAAAIGDVAFIQSQVDLVDLASTPAEIVRSSQPFRQSDRNGWQPLHEAGRSGQLNVLKLLLEVDTIDNAPNNEGRTWRRRAGKLKINVNARTNNNRGFTVLKIVEDNHGEDHICAQLLRELGAVSLGFRDEVSDNEE